MWVCASVSAGARKVQKRALDLLKLEVQKVVSLLTWVLELNLEEQGKLLNIEPSCPPPTF